MPVGEHEAIAVCPLRVSRVVAHDLVIEQICDGSAAQRCAGVAAFGLFHGIYGEQPQRVDGKLIERKRRKAGGHIRLRNVLSCRVIMPGLKHAGLERADRRFQSIFTSTL